MHTVDGWISVQSKHKANPRKEKEQTPGKTKELKESRFDKPGDVQL
jgi:hypothetical protein